MKTRKQKLKLVKEIIASVDCDIYNGIFVNPEEPEEMTHQIDYLVSLVDDYEKEEGPKIFPEAE